MEKKKNGWLLWVLLIFLPPVGIIYMWITRKNYSSTKKIGFSIGFSIWWLICAVMGNDTTDVSTSEPTTEIIAAITTESVSEITTETTAALTTEATTQKITKDFFIKDVKQAIKGAVGENEAITDVTLDNKNLCVYVDFSQTDPSPLTFEDLMISRTSSITDAILNLTQYESLWKTITVDFNDLGYIKNKKKDMELGSVGKYFPIEGFEINYNSTVIEATTEVQTETPPEPQVWIPATGSKYHSNSSCSNMHDPRQVPLSEAENSGYEPCGRCY